MPKTCNCDGEMKPALLTIIRKMKGMTFTVFGVPGYRCGDCGDEVISSEVAKKLQRTLTYRSEQILNGVKFSTEATPIVEFEGSVWDTRTPRRLDQTARADPLAV